MRQIQHLIFQVVFPSSFILCAARIMASLVDRYSSRSVKSCLSTGERGLCDPLVDLPLLDRGQRCFAVPPGIEVT